MSKRDSFIFYRSFYEAIAELPKDNQLELFLAISEFSLNFKQPKLSGMSKTIWILIKPQLEANIKKFHNGKKPKIKSKREATDKQKGSKTEGNVNVNENNNVNVNDNYLHYFDECFKDERWITALKKNYNLSDEKFNELFDKFSIGNYPNLISSEKLEDAQRHFNNHLKKLAKDHPIEETKAEKLKRKQESIKKFGP